MMDWLGIARAHVVGNFLGGAAAQWLAINHPDRVAKLVVVSSWARSDEVFRWMMRTRRQLLTDCSIEVYISASAIFLYVPAWVENKETLAKFDERSMAGFVGVDIMAWPAVSTRF